jgi:rhodanese-related sulfurtransferase
MKKSFISIFILALAVMMVSSFSVISCKASQMEEEMMEGYMDVSPEEAKKLIDENMDLIIIDVSPKYDEGHLPGAINYYIGDGSLEAAIPTLDPDSKYLVYCHVDSASIGGAQALIDAGFKNVYRLEGNYAAWVDAGYEIEK